jgi:DNA repair protein RecO (recombination protein O)
VSTSESIGLILHSRRFRENSRIIEVFTQEFGRIALLARVASKKAGSRSSGLQPFQESLFRWRGRSELQNLQSLDTLTVYELKDKATICGMYCNELIMYLTAKFLPLPDLYLSYRDTLKTLVHSKSLSVPLREFEMTLLEQLGYGLNLETDCLSAEPLQSSGDYYYHAQQGFSRQSPGNDALRIDAEILEGIRKRKFTEKKVARQARYILGSAIQFQLGNKPLKSRQLLQSITKYSHE